MLRHETWEMGVQLSKVNLGRAIALESALQCSNPLTSQIQLTPSRHRFARFSDGQFSGKTYKKVIWTNCSFHW